GLSETRGKFVARIDPDDRYKPHFLTAVLPKFDEHPEVGLVYGDVSLIDDQGTVMVERGDTFHQGRDFYGNELIALLERNIICAPSVLARREAWLGVPPVPEWLAFNDWYFTVMMARKWNFYFIHNVLAEYRVHSENHHSKIVRDRTEERSLLSVLDTVFASQEVATELEQSKLRSRRAI